MFCFTIPFMTPHLDPARATWHITFGTYGTRLHGDARPTVDRKQNLAFEPFIYHNENRLKQNQQSLKTMPLYLSLQQRKQIETMMPAICQRGDWSYRICAAPVDADHVHVLLDATCECDPDAMMKWLKRWVGEALTAKWGKPASGTWWAKCGSTKPIKDEDYLNNVYEYIRRQRTLSVI
jgi:REP element-mobilizing transposase RayT